MADDNRLFIKYKKDEDFVANDSSSFFDEYLKDIKNYFNSVKGLSLSSSLTITPNNYQEDYVQAYRRSHFVLNDWRIVGCFVNFENGVTEVIFINKSNSFEGFVFNFVTKEIKALFYRGFEIQESIDSPRMDEELFLESLGIAEEEASFDMYFSFDDDVDFSDDEEIVEAQNISIVKPVFEANSKRKILNLGSNETNSIDVDEDEDVEINIERPAFEGFKKGKVRNLGYSGNFKKKPIERDVAPTISEVSRDAFTPNSTKKIVNLGSSSTANKPKILKVVPKKPTISVVESKELEKPSFVPESKKEIVNYDAVIKEESKDWRVIDIYKIKPNVYAGEHCVYRHEDFKVYEPTFANVENKLKNLNRIAISNECYFAPKKIDNNDKVFSLLNKFNFDSYKVIVLKIENDEAKEALLINKDNESLCFLISVNPAVEVVAISYSGMDLDDRGLPYLTFAQLINLTK